MKSTLALLICGLVAVSAIKVDNIKPYKFAPGKMYLYDYSAQLLTGIPKIADQFAGLKMKAQIALQASQGSSEQVTMKLTNIKISQSQDLKNVASGLNIEDEQSSSEDMKAKWIREYQRELSKPITFTHVNGEVVTFEADQSEPEWSLNIKKSILTLFHLNLQPKQVMRSTDANQIAKPVSQEDLTYYGVYESGIAGICESVYELDQIADLHHHDELSEVQAVLNVTKTKNFRNCLTRATLALNDNMSSRHSPRKAKTSTGAFDEAVRGYYPIPSHYTPSVEANSPIKQYTTTKYNISLEKDVAQIESIRSEGKIIYSTFGDNIMAYSHQKVTLVRVSQAAAGSLGSPVNSQMHSELSYQFPKMDEAYSQIAMDMPHPYLFSQEPVEQLTANLPKLFQSLARAVLGESKSSSSSSSSSNNNNAGNNKDAMQKVVQIVNSLAALPRESIEQMYQSIAQAGLDENASQQAKLSRKMFLDALALTGSNEAAKFIAKMIVNREVTGHEAREMLAALPRNMNFPTAKTLDAYLELVQSQRVASDNLLHPAVAVAFGKMVNTAFTKNGRIESVERASASGAAVAAAAAAADEATVQLAQAESNNNQWQAQLRSAAAKKEDLERYIVAVTRMLENADNFSKKVAAIECLAHMGAKQVLSALAPYVTGSASRDVLPGYTTEDSMKERNFLRTVAIYSLAHVARKNAKQVLPLVLPVYRNSAEPHEMRLAAFTIAMLCSPEQHIIESIASDLYHESNKQVTNFVISALNSIGNLTTPCQRSLAAAAAQAVESAPKTNNKSNARAMYSTYKSGDYYDEKRSSGMWYAAEVINSRVTPIPRAGYLALAQISSPFHDELLEIGFEAKGLERIAKRIISENGLIARLFQAKQQASSQQQQREREQEQSDRKQEAAKLNLFVKMFEQTSIYPLDEEMINQYVEHVENWARQVISQGFTGTFVKLLMPSTISKVSVSQIGLPVVVAHKRPLIVSLKINKLNARENTHANGEYKGYTVDTEIEPRVMYSSYAFVYGIEPVSKTTIGTHVEKTYHAYAPLKATLTHQHANQQWSLLVKPKSGYEAVYHKSEALTFLSKAATVFAPAADWLESAQTIRKENASPVKVERTFAHGKVPIAAKVIVDTEKSELNEQYIRKNIAKNGLVSTLIAIFRNSNLAAREVRVQLEDNSEATQRDISFHWNTSSERFQPEESSDADDTRDCPNGVTDEIASRFIAAITGAKVQDVHQCSKKLARDAARMYSVARNNLKWIAQGEKVYRHQQDQEEANHEIESNEGREKLYGGNEENMIQRTEFIVRGNKACFTTHPVRACANGSAPSETIQATRGFHCLPRSSPLAQQYMSDAETSVLRQLANKKVEFRQRLTVAKACAA